MFGSITDALFGNPSQGALDMYSLEDFQNMLQQYYGPYQQAGENALPTLEEQYMMLLNNPEMLHQQFGSTYEQSPGYQYQMDEAMNAGNMAAASGGMLGSPSHQNQMMTQASNIANQDYWQYMENLLGLHGQGLQTAGNMANQGYNAANAMAGNTGAFMGSQMGLAQQGGSNMQNALWGFLGQGTNALLSPGGWLNPGTGSK